MADTGVGPNVRHVDNVETGNEIALVSCIEMFRDFRRF